MTATPASAELKAKVKEMLVRQLKLQVEPAEIEDDAPLFGDEGLGLDSIDVLEVVASLEKEFGVSIESQEQGERVLRSVNALADFVLERRQQGSPGSSGRVGRT
jgi:acyl carrier protein